MIPEHLLTDVPQHMRHAAKKFWRNVQIGEPDECWLWTGNTNKKGYGQIRIPRVGMVMAHRHAYTLINGPLEAGQVVLHACDNPPCVNPRHLSAGSNVDNMQDMVQKGRHAEQQVTHCPANHPYDETNTYISPSGFRLCRACNRDRARERRARGET